MKKYTIGTDVGGTKIHVGLVSPRYKLVQDNKTLLKKTNKKAVLKSIIDAIDALFLPQVQRIGVGITGIVTIPNGVSVQSPNLPRDWRSVPLKTILQKRYHRPVQIDNDANCTALAEATLGAGKACHTVVTIGIGTGLGVGVTINKQLLRGAQNIIEFGHTTIADSSPRCGCGHRGHFESLVSGSAMTKLYRAATGTSKDTYTIITAARSGNKAAKRLLKQIAHHLAVGIANCIHAYNPDIIILTGGLADIHEIIEPAKKEYTKLLMSPALQKTKVIRSKLGCSASVLGATLITTPHK